MRPNAASNINRGFHTIDLAVAILLLGLLAAISVPSIRETLHGHTLKSETRHLKSTMEQLTLQAAQREERILLTIGQAEYTARIGGSDGPLLITREFQDPVTALLTSIPPRTIYFHKSGVSSPASITLTTGSEYCSVILSLRGRVSVECY